MGPVAERLAGTMHVKLKTENKNVSLITRKPKTRTYAVSAVAWSCGGAGVSLGFDGWL